MRLPIKRQHAAQTLSLPDFSGGLNMRDGITEVLDNQLIDCNNVWYKDGVLKTRPGINAVEGGIVDIPRFGSAQTVETKSFRDIKHTFDSQVYYLQVARVSMGSKAYLKFYWVNHNGKKEMPGINLTSNITFFVCMQKNILYCFTSQKEIYKFDVNNANGSWQEAKSDIYVPKVLIQCEKISAEEATKEQVLESGVMLEGFNILSDYYQMSYNSYNPSIVTKENPAHEMRYHIVENVANKKYQGKTVTAVYNGVKHTVTLTGNKTATVEKEVNAEDKLQMRVWRNMVSFWDKVGDEGEIVKISEGGEDDLIITAPYISSDSDKEKIYKMTKSTWFGGGNAGLQGGTRLFLCGNSSEGSLVVWSDLDKPLFFPENNYFYVGDTTDYVTGFGKQSDMLVIFKRNETWYTTYQQNKNITAKNLINQSVVDYTASSVYFPLVQINPNIGCVYPDSIQLCRNRLVWLGNQNKVYTLVNESAYNERSVFCVSEMVNRKIDSSYYSLVSSCDWNGYYCLCLENEMFLMDYNCYGFTHIASYSKTEDANVKIPWFYWTLPVDGTITLIDDNIVLSYYFNGETYSTCGIMINTLSEENVPTDKIFTEKSDSAGFEIVDTPILSTISTKLFDFGVPHIRKNVEQINLQLGNNGGKEIKVYFVTENGLEETEIYLDCNNTRSRTAGYIDSHAIFPCIKQVLRFGLKVETEGNLAVDGAIIKFRTTGGAR